MSIRCPRCHGRGRNGKSLCLICQGHGHVPACAACHGAGLVERPLAPFKVLKCETCKGTGLSRGIDVALKSAPPPAITAAKVAA